MPGVELRADDRESLSGNDDGIRVSLAITSERLGIVPLDHFQILAMLPDPDAFYSFSEQRGRERPQVPPDVVVLI